MSDYTTNHNPTDDKVRPSHLSGFNMIVARDMNFGIGGNNQLAWYIPRDLKHFKELTKGKKLIMGRNTYNSIIARNGRPLEGRDHYVMTTTKHFEYNFTNSDGTTNTVRTASPKIIKHFVDKQDFFVIGGAKTYKTLLPYVTTVYETLIQNYYPHCDTFLDDNYLDGFKEVDREHDCSRDRETDAEVQLIFSTFERKPKTD
jgi:dihydrofolate reductase